MCPASERPSHDEPSPATTAARTLPWSRWIDGSIHLWSDRRTAAGRGEVSSGLRFDVLDERDGTTPTVEPSEDDADPG